MAEMTDPAPMSDIIRQGHLSKLGEHFPKKKWHRRYNILRSDRIFDVYTAESAIGQKNSVKHFNVGACELMISA